ncbi:hypothetical protein HK096_008275 [Nowakowskiella sp. JEL0078]|nr:hypothetical protein HK096_008275 [Nowakowskiella sp. JEL0078]
MEVTTFESTVKYILVLDFEATCDNNKSFGPQEIIEFPIVVIDLKSNAIIAEFHEYVRPITNPGLTEFCTQLTGIEQITVDCANTFSEVFAQVQEFLQVNSFTTSNSIFLTCGDWDLETMLPAQLQLSKIPSSSIFSQWINLKVPFMNVFPEQKKTRLFGMVTMLNKSGIKLIGRHHSGIDDTRNIASIARELVRLGHPMNRPTKRFSSDGKVLKLPSLENSNENSNKPKFQKEKILKKPKNPEKVKNQQNMITVSPVVDIGVNLTHRHFSNVSEVLERARNANVMDIIVTGLSLLESEDAIRLCRKYQSPEGPRLWCTVGIHPHNADKFTKVDINAKLRNLITENRDIVVAIGECGLDFERNFSSVSGQISIFQEQLKLAHELELPLFLHERAAFDDMVNIMQTEFPEGVVRGVIHCFTGTETMAKAYVGMGLSLGITGWICDEKRGIGLAEMVSKIPRDKLLVETDSPFLLPRTMLGKVKKSERPECCEPYLISWVVKKIAELCLIEMEEVASITTNNAITLFGLNRS